MSTWSVIWRRLRASLRGPSFEDIAAAADGELDPDFYKRTRVMMPNVTLPRAGKPAPAPVTDVASMPDGVTIAQRGDRFLLGWAGGSFGIWDAWAPAEPVRRYEQDPTGWDLAWTDFSELEPATAVRARGSWPSSIRPTARDAAVARDAAATYDARPS